MITVKNIQLFCFFNGYTQHLCVGSKNIGTKDEITANSCVIYLVKTLLWFVSYIFWWDQLFNIENW